MKRRRRPSLQIPEARDLTPPAVSTSNLLHIVCPSSPICDSKAEYPHPSVTPSLNTKYSLAAMDLKNLHHQDPRGTRGESASAARLERALSMHSAAEVQDTQRAPPPAANHGPSKAHQDPWQRYLSAKLCASCLETKSQQNTTIKGTGKASCYQYYPKWPGLQHRRD